MALEDFTTFTKVGSRITVNSPTEIYFDLVMNPSDYLYKDYGQSFFDTDQDIEIDFELEGVSGEGSGNVNYIGIISITSLFGTVDTLTDPPTNGLLVSYRTWRYRVGRINNGSYNYTEPQQPFNGLRYIKYRQAAGTGIWIYEAFTDSNRQNLEFSIQNSGGNFTNIPYLQFAMSRGTSSGGSNFRGYIRNLEIVKPGLEVPISKPSLMLGRPF